MKDSLYEHSLPELKAGIAKSAECVAHMHAHFEILYVRKEIVPVMICGNIYTLHPGDCAVILPEMVHNHMNGDEHNEIFLAVCAPHLAGHYEETIKLNFAESPIIRNKTLPEIASFLLDTLAKQLDTHTVYTRHEFEITISTFQLFFAYILPLLNLRKRKDSDASGLTQCIMDYISQNSKRKLTLEIVSEELGISKYKISKVFTNQLQMNFNQYLNQLRINTAKKLLTSTDTSVTTICYESGFSAVRTFNTAFFQITGLSPKEYRQKHLDGELELKYDFYLDTLPS